MKLESQVCSLEQAKKLIEMGVRIDSMLCFEVNPYEKSEIKLVPNNLVYYERRWSDGNYIPTFTVAELGVMLPLCVKHNGTFFYLLQSTTYDEHRIMSYEDGDHIEGSQDPDINPIADKNEANLRARMLIYLLENGHITAEEVNNRLTNS